MPNIRVLIIDDSALVRKLMVQILSTTPGIEVVGTAVDPYDAREKIKQTSPDVLTLDVEMPKMDGVTFLSNLMRLRPMPVVMVSSLTEKGADITLRALELGAVDFVTKPKIDLAHEFSTYADEIVSKIRIAARANVDSLATRSKAASTTKTTAPLAIKSSLKTTDKIFAIGASTGGTEAIREIIQTFPADAPGTVITQHIPPGFSKSFAARLDQISALTVFEATDGQHIVPGHAYVAPGDKHLEVVRDGARYVCRVYEGEPVMRHCPSVEVLFDSVAANVGRNAYVTMLTGMGDDGAKAMKRARDAGAFCVAQDEASSVVWGMPGQAVKLGAVDEVQPLAAIAGRLFSVLAKRDAA